MALGTLFVSLVAGGCTYGGGELLYALGVGRPPKNAAQFTLTQEPILILVDDPGSTVTWPAAKQYIFDDLAQELLRNQAASKIIPRQTLEQLRASMVNYERRGAREIGEAAGAAQVLWIEIEDFFAEEYFSQAQTAAYVNARVKVLNVAEKERRSQVRLWPDSPGGHPVSASLAGDEAAREETKDAIAKKLSERLAEDVAKLFYEHRQKAMGR